MVTLATLTPQTAAQRLSAGAGVLGLAVPLLAPAWGPQPSSADAAMLTLTVPVGLVAPWRGTIESIVAADFRDAGGQPLGSPTLTGRVAVVRMHPQAAQRLATLAARRYAPGTARQPRPLPWFMVIRDWDYPNAPNRIEAGDPIANNQASTISFHDGRGLIVCPVAAAAMFADLSGDTAALRGPAVAGAPAGTLAAIAATPSMQGRVAHIVDPHGDAFKPVGTADLQFLGASGATATGGPVAAWPNGSGIAPNPIGNGRVRVGLMETGKLGTAAVAAPALPAGITLPREFVRVCAVDLPLYLLGNRTQQQISDLGGDDGQMPADLLPQVRDGIAVTYIADSLDTLAQAQAVAERTNGQSGALHFVVSPVIESNIGVPPAPLSARWPWPVPAGQAADPLGGSPVDAAAGATASWTSGNDMVVTLAAGAIPAGAHVRIYPRRFQRIVQIADAPSFVRGDGGAAVAPLRPANVNPPPPPAAVAIRVPNPFGLADSQSHPPDAQLAVDLVVTDRTGARRIWGGRTIPIVDGGAMPPPDSFDLAPAEVIDSWPDWFRSPATVKLFGIAPLGPPKASGANLIDIAKSLQVAAPPRQGPRLPTMGRFETIVATGLPVGGQATLGWDAVLTGGWWARSTRSSAHALGNPGNPAGPDIHAAGIRVDGLLAYDLAGRALRRSQPMLPIPAFLANGNIQPGWAAFLAAKSMGPPPAILGTGDSAGAVLTTVAANCETPELALFDLPDETGPLTLQKLVDDIHGQFPALPSISTGDLAEPDRVVNEVRREVFIATNGQRDAIWSLRRAVRDARELIYIEGPAFQPTRYDGDPDTLPDLLAEIDTAMGPHPGVRLLVATSRETDFSGRYEGFARQAIAARYAAIKKLGDKFPGRVAAFHPVGFPGRPAQLRTTCVIVDDVWSFVGTSHWRRRGMTFDGGVDIASFDRNFAEGYSVAVRRFRQELMAAKLGVALPVPGVAPTADWDRLGRPRSAFAMVADLLGQGGQGRIEPLWQGRTDDSIGTAGPDQADPNGTLGGNAAVTLAALLDTLGNG